MFEVVDRGRDFYRRESGYQTLHSTNIHVSIRYQITICYEKETAPGIAMLCDDYKQKSGSKRKKCWFVPANNHVSDGQGIEELTNVEPMKACQNSRILPLEVGGFWLQPDYSLFHSRESTAREISARVRGRISVIQRI